MNDNLYEMPVSFRFERPTSQLNQAMESRGLKLFVYSVLIEEAGPDNGWVYAKDLDAAKLKFGERTLISLESFEDIRKKKNENLQNSVPKN